MDKTPDGNFLLSSRHTNTIYHISRETGNVIWRLGGKMSDFEFDEGAEFSHQHHIRYRGGDETHMLVTMLDNAKVSRIDWGNDAPTAR